MADQINLPVGFDFSGADAQVQAALDNLKYQFNKQQSPGFQLNNPQSVVQALNNPVGAAQIAGSPALQSAVAQLAKAITIAAGTVANAANGHTPPGVPPPTPPAQAQTVQQLTQLNNNIRQSNTQGQQQIQQTRQQVSQQQQSMRQSPGGGTGGGSGFGAVNRYGLQSALYSILGGSATSGIASSLAGSGASSLSSLLGAGEAAGPIGQVVSVATAAGLRISDYSSDLEKIKRDLQSNVATEPWNGPLYQSQFNSGLNNTAVSYNTSQQTVGAVMDILGRTGVQAPDIENLSKNTLAFSNITGLPADQMAQMAGGMATQGGMSADQIGAVFDAIVNGATALGKVSGDSALSMTKLSDTLSDFSKAAGGTALSLKGTESLISLAGYLGPGIDAGTAVGAMAGATGLDRMTYAAKLGMTEQQYAAIQNDPTKLYGAAGSTLLSQTAGMTGINRIDMLETMNKSEGLFNLSGASQPATDKFFQQLIKNGPQGAASAYTALQKSIGTPTATALRARGRAAGEETQSGSGKLVQTAESGLNKTLDTVEHNPVGSALVGAGILSALVNPVTVGIATGLAAPVAGLILILNKLGVSTDRLPGAVKDAIEAGWHDLVSVLSGGGTAGASPSTGGTFTSVPGGGAWQPGLIAPGVVPNSGATVEGMQVPAQLLPQYEAASKKYGVPLNILLAQGFKESTFNPNAKSGAGAQGIAQFMPDTWMAESKASGIKGSPYDPSVAIPMQAYLDQQLYQQEGNWQNALAAYNAGPGNLAAGEGYASSVQGAAATVVTINVAVTDKTTGGIAAAITQSQANNPPKQRSGRQPYVPPTKPPHGPHRHT